MANILGIVLLSSLSSAPTLGSLFVSSWGWAASACDEDNVRASGERVESEIISTNSESLAGAGELSRGVIQLLSVISHLEKIVIYKSYRCKMNLHNNICCVSIICNWYLYYICSYILSPSISVVLSLITHDMGCSRYSQGCDHQQSVTILWLNIDSPQPSHDIGTCHVTQTQTMSDVRCLMSRCVSLVSIAWERPIRGWSAVLATIRKWWETASDLDNGSRRIMSFLNWSSFIVWKFEWPFYTIDFFWSFIFEMCVSCRCWNHIHSLSKALRNQNLSGSLI